MSKLNDILNYDLRRLLGYKPKPKAPPAPVDKQPLSNASEIFATIVLLPVLALLLWGMFKIAKFLLLWILL